MPECLPDLPRYVLQRDDGSWIGADDREGPWRPVPAPQSGLPWLTDGPAVPESREPASVATDPSPTPADRVTAARVGRSPTAWRLARRNGELFLQAGSFWTQGREFGIEWNDVPTVNLDELEAPNA
jgi:hypothetical protein